MNMSSNTSNELKALNSVNATQSNALDSISSQAIAHMQKGNRMTLKDADKIKEAIKNSDDFVGGSDDIIKVIDSVPEVVISTDTDTISRKAAIELCDWYDNPSMREDLEKLRPARLSADAISKKEAIEAADAIIGRDKSGNNAVVNAMIAWREYIKNLQPAQHESDSGRWERHYSRPGVYADLYWHCSKCGYKTDYQYANVNHRYCPNCGRKMEREVSDENRIHYGRDHGQQSGRTGQDKAAMFKL